MASEKLQGCLVLILWTTFSKSMFHSLSCYFSAAQITFLFATQTSPILCFRASATACRVQGKISPMPLTHSCWVFSLCSDTLDIDPARKQTLGKAHECPQWNQSLEGAWFLLMVKLMSDIRSAEGQTSPSRSNQRGLLKESLSSLLLYSKGHGFPCSYLEHLFSSFFTIAET